MAKSRKPQNKTKQKRRAPRSAWKKGQSGNPGGRPKEAKAFKEFCRDLMEREGVGEIPKLTHAVDERVRLAAWRFIAEYAFGKPLQPVGGDDSAPPLRIRIEE
mgnify:FL=1